MLTASELKDHFSRLQPTERWQVIFEKDNARLISPHGAHGDIEVPYEIADAAGLQHAKAQVAAQLAERFQQAEQGIQRGGRY